MSKISNKSNKSSSISKRHFTVVIDRGGKEGTKVPPKENGLYVSSTPSSAARKAVSKLCASNKSKKVEFHIREITQDSKKKTYGPYIGYIEKLAKPIELKGRVIKYKPVAKLNRKTSKKIKGGAIGGDIEVDGNLSVKDFYKYESTWVNRNLYGNIYSPKPDYIPNEKILLSPKKMPYFNEPFIFFGETRFKTHPNVYQNCYKYVAYNKIGIFGKKAAFKELEIIDNEPHISKKIPINDISEGKLRSLKNFIILERLKKNVDPLFCKTILDSLTGVNSDIHINQIKRIKNKFTPVEISFMRDIEELEKSKSKNNTVYHNTIHKYDEKIKPERQNFLIKRLQTNMPIIEL